MSGHWVLQNRFFENNVDFMSVLPIGVDVRSFPITVSYRGSYVADNWSASFTGAYSRNLEIKDRNDPISYALNRAGAETDWDVVRISGSATYQFCQWLVGSRVS